MMAWHRAWRSGGLVVLVGLAAGCNSSPPVAEPQPPPVRVSKPLDRKVPDYDHYDGRIAAVETVELRARIRGHLIKVNFQDGQMVKKGDLLYEIDPDTFQAQLESAQAEQWFRSPSVRWPGWSMNGVRTSRPTTLGPSVSRTWTNARPTWPGARPP